MFVLEARINSGQNFEPILTLYLPQIQAATYQPSPLIVFKLASSFFMASAVSVPVRAL
jgi:hypothetical protein